MWGNMRPTPGAFLICMAMCGSGPRTGPCSLYSRQPGADPRVRLGLAAVSIGVAPGAYRRGPAFGSAATATPRQPQHNFGFRVGFQRSPADVASPETVNLRGCKHHAVAGRRVGGPWAVEAHDERDGNLTSSVTVSGYGGCEHHGYLYC